MPVTRPVQTLHQHCSICVAMLLQCPLRCQLHSPVQRAPPRAASFSPLISRSNRRLVAGRRSARNAGSPGEDSIRSSCRLEAVRKLLLLLVVLAVPAKYRWALTVVSRFVQRPQRWRMRCKTGRCFSARGTNTAGSWQQPERSCRLTTWCQRGGC